MDFGNFGPGGFGGGGGGLSCRLEFSPKSIGGGGVLEWPGFPLSPPQRTFGQTPFWIILAKVAGGKSGLKNP